MLGFFFSSCNVTNWADPVRAEDMGINGVESNRAAGVKTIPLQSAAQGGSLGKLCRNEIQTFNGKPQSEGIFFFFWGPFCHSYWL